MPLLPEPTICPTCGRARDWRGVCAHCVVASFLEPAPAPPDLPSRLGDYELIEEIGRGGMGAVWRARQEKLQRDVALKTVRGGVLAGAEARERFRREALAVARLRHPGIVAVHEVGEQDGELFLALEYVRGESLAQRLRAGPLPPRAAAQLAREVAAAVQHAHEQGILHRDLKPSNILLDAARADAPRLTDFGIAKRVENSSELRVERESSDATGSVSQPSTLNSPLTVTGQMLGTLSYAAPEQAGARAPHTPATDVYGLGAVLFHCLTGRPPFLGDEPLVLARAVVEQEPPAPRSLNPTLPRDLETICLQCLEKNPARRYPSATALAEDLTRFLDRQPVQARPVGFAGRAGRWCQRRPVVATLSAALALTLIAGGVTSEVLRRRAVREQKAAEASRDELRLNLYAADVKLAEQALVESNDQRARALLDRHLPPSGAPDLRGLEWRLLSARLAPDTIQTITNLPPGAWSLGFTPDDAGLLAGDAEGHLWRLDWRRPGLPEKLFRAAQAIHSLEFSPTGRELALVFHPPAQRTGSVAVVSWPEGKPLAAFPSAAVRAAFAPDGERLVVVEGQVMEIRGPRALEVWDWRRPTRLARLPDLGNRFALSPDGRRLIVGSRAATNQAGLHTSDWTLLEFPSLRPLATRPADAQTTGLQFSEDGRVIFATANLDRVQAWDLDTGEFIVHEIPGAGCTDSPLALRGTNLLALSGTDQRVHLLEWTRHPLRLTPRRTFRSEGGNANPLAATRDGRCLAGTAAVEPFRFGTRGRRRANSPAR